MRPIRLLFALAVLALPLAAAAQGGAAPRPGVDYTLIDPPQPLTGTPGKIEVVEVFGYGCIHCARFEPLLKNWTKDLPDDVEFLHFPLATGGVWEVFGRAYYTAEAMGLLERSHEAMFNAVHIEKSIRSAADIPQFYARFGVDPQVFESTMNSFAINAKIARAKQIAPRWAIEGTPTLVVNGKYRVMATPEGGLPGMLKTTDWLIAQERAAATAQTN